MNTNDSDAWLRHIIPPSQDKNGNSPILEPGHVDTEFVLSWYAVLLSPVSKSSRSDFRVTKACIQTIPEKEEIYKMTVAHQKYGFSKNMLLD